MDKKALFIIVLLAIIAAAAIACLMSEPFSESLYSFGVDYLGPNIVSGATTVVTAPLAWGAQSLAYGAVIWAVIGITVAVMYTVGRLSWSRWKSKPSLPKVTVQRPYQDQLSTPELYTQPPASKQPVLTEPAKEEVIEAEPKPAA